MRRSHSPHRGLSAVACGASGPLKLLLAVVGAATDLTPAGRDEIGAVGAATIGDVTVEANGSEYMIQLWKKVESRKTRQSCEQSICLFRQCRF